MRYTQQFHNLTNSTPIYAWVNQKRNASVAESAYVMAYAEILPSFLIEKGCLISNPDLMKKARVLQPFYVKVQLDRGEFVATSDISDIYEVRETKGLAVRNYLYSLVDELIWFEENQESLLGPMLESFNKLQLYLKLV
ncbi:MAG TPA: hypothetical protein VFB60_18665 [Ktedonobacteraceae bacterium]|nr:hypothetical protein [Ktedonobacteraceae bacterium]